MKIEEKYLEILKLVKSGLTIQQACNVSNTNRTMFYKSITKEQKNELRFYKSTTLIHGTSGHFGSRDFMSLDINENDL